MKTRQSKKPQILVILGPTASGKSELAVKLAQKFNGEIISADSRQVYKGLDIGSGKVLRDSIFLPYIYKEIEHHLLDVASPKRTFTVVQYQKLAKKALQKIFKKGKIPIICGGTGFYIDALIYDYQFPEVAPQPKLRKQLEEKLTEQLFKQLKKLDPQRAKNIDKNNRRRLIRALEIVLTIKKPVPSLASLWGSTSLQESVHYRVLKIGIKKSPKELKRLIAERLKKRLNQGLIKEVKKIHNPSVGRGLSWQRLDDLGLEYRYVSRYLQGLITKKEMVEAILKESWHYTKRQIIWFKRDRKIIWINNKKEAERIISLFLERNPQASA